MFVGPGSRVHRVFRVFRLVVLGGLGWMSPHLAAAEEYFLSADPIDSTKTEGEFESIQAALDGVSDGDVITLTAGTYEVNLNFPQIAITLQGDPAAGQDEVILDGSGCVRGAQECSVITFDWTSPLGVGNTAELRGLTIQGGKGRNFDGVGASNDTRGAGVWSKNGDMEIEKVSLSGNWATYAGGIYLYASTPTLTQVTLSGNGASYGGGMNLVWSSPTLTQVSLLGNWANGEGGGMYVQSSDPTLTQVTLAGNSVNLKGGGMYLHESTPTLTQVTLSGNSANDAGGGMYLYYSTPKLSQVTLSDNSATAEGGGMYLDASSPTLTQVTFSGNSSAGGGGGGMYLFYSSPTLTQVSLTGNNAGYGGGMFLVYSSPTLTQVFLSGNGAYHGGGMYLESSDPTLTQVTLSGNSATHNGGGMYLHESTPKLHNSIIAHNTAPTGATLYQFDSPSSYSPTFINTLLYPVSGGSLYNVSAPSAPFNQDPLFVDDPLDGTTTDDNYHLQSNSPARDVNPTTECYNPATQLFNLSCSDPDGSLLDLGAWGGPGADEWDQDWDDSPAMWWPTDDDGGASVANGYSTTSFDCDDNDPVESPAGTETCDGKDNDCDGSIDDGVTTTFYADKDHDGVGDPATSTQACTQPDGYVRNTSDCDDDDNTIHPGAPETCGDGIDGDCLDGDATCPDTPTPTEVASDTQTEVAPTPPNCGGCLASDECGDGEDFGWSIGPSCGGSSPRSSSSSPVDSGALVMFVMLLRHVRRRG